MCQVLYTPEVITASLALEKWWGKEDDPFLLGPGNFFGGELLVSGRVPLKDGGMIGWMLCWEEAWKWCLRHVWAVNEWVVTATNRF